MLGLPLGDFERLTPAEFAAACKAEHDRREAEMHDSWSRMRMLATITVQPHVKGKLTPQKMLPFPWESEAPPRAAPVRLSKQERERRLAECLAALEKEQS